MFYLMTHILFTVIWCQIYVKDHSDSERKSAATTTWATLFDLQLGVLYESSDR